MTTSAILLAAASPDLARTERDDALTLVTYNMFSHNRYAGYRWQERLDNFVEQVIIPHRPAIVALQEVYLQSDCPCYGSCKQCEKRNWGDYMGYLMRSIRDRYGPSYRIATIVESHPGIVCWCLADEYEGDAIIYDSEQVTLVPAYPLDGQAGCDEKYMGVFEFYENGPLDRVDCFKQPGSDRWSYAVRAIFEYPRGSSRYFQFLNTHGEPCDIVAAIEYLQRRQETLRDDVASYLAIAPTTVSVYPPIFAGDMNCNEYPTCQNAEEIDATVEYYFYDAPQDWVIDKVWIGKPDAPGREIRFKADIDWAVVPPEGIVAPFNRVFPLGLSVGGKDNPLSDHSPSLVEIRVDTSRFAWLIPIWMMLT